jgi:hypothetical protein
VIFPLAKSISNRSSDDPITPIRSGAEFFPRTRARARVRLKKSKVNMAFVMARGDDYLGVT